MFAPGDLFQHGRLASTLRILATGESLRSAHFQFRHGEKTVQRYFHRVCQALFVNLKDQYMKVVLHTLLTVQFVVASCKYTVSQ